MSKLEKNMEEMLDIDVSNTPENGCATRKDQTKDVTEDREMWKNGALFDDESHC